ncbi:excalibur calcium-binding domain-containing protein [Paenibacillus rhizovicinus]|uniref:Excalibur calcium-binding domain-containing protein n=1 Tax=Paenibacillus rhizovicinus TaxID=2704463 RepID=A0A6C0NUQ4_9BACL|nr:excalibur calcium-binding domain-containing protein [Paenibacillus rhizovicinus]QHW29929.1 excalibur calcium-binding domain-containing protein [Paenibacillus rhizovicinus]
MKAKTISLGLALTLLLSLAAGSAVHGTASAAAKTYRNCTELNKDYKGGVARSASVKNKGGKTKYKPFVSQALYDANAKSDRDKDGIACEK